MPTSASGARLDPKVATTSKGIPCELCKKVDDQHDDAIKQRVHTICSNDKDPKQEYKWRRQCGCLKTSDKLKELLKKFPAPPPPAPPSSPTAVYTIAPCISSYPETTCVSTCCAHIHQPLKPIVPNKDLVIQKYEDIDPPTKRVSTKSWHVMGDLVALLQLSVTATALGLYYIIYCYMQLVYFTLRSAMFFHNADGPMKITIGVVTVTSLIVGFNLMLRLERMVGISY